MGYKILPYSYTQAKRLGVEIKPSTNILKKIDVFKNGIRVARIGARSMKDYPTYLEYEKSGLFQKKSPYAPVSIINSIHDFFWKIKRFETLFK
jgi:hypothetical protein